ncbi:hypothetical protein MTBBW1_1060024 [Desulfamplus magnetovallimortis]|uniref:Histidine kinase n=2 Tax=Desulfamplus magnetovallimortis TaxID=1246637 RepID=A0A1W1H5B6_9BACT|nr:hypothetical protein MTBBW1_1060024 [Desulfamplus magnetovallimortis]
MLRCGRWICHGRYSRPHRIKGEFLALNTFFSEIRILAVDSIATDRKILADQLAKWQIEVTEVDSAPKALQNVYSAQEKNLPFSIVFVDMQLPGMNGESLGRAIRADKRLKQIKLVMMLPQDSMNDEELVSRIKATGFNTSITKPVSMDDLQNILFDILTSSEPDSDQSHSSDTGKQENQYKSKAELHETKELEAQHIKEITYYDNQKTETRHREKTIGDHSGNPQSHYDKKSLSNRKNEAFLRPDIKILLVEDNPTNQMVVMGILNHFGLSATTAFNGLEAITLMEKHLWDIVIMDVQMPKMDGLEATRLIRNPESNVQNHNLPIIALTAHAMKGDREKCLEAGMDDYLTKPVNPKLLMAAITKWAGHKDTISKPANQFFPHQDKDKSAKFNSNEVTNEKKTQTDKTTKTEHPAIFDRQKFLELMDGDEELGLSVSTLFLEKTPCDIKELRNFIEKKDIDNAIKLAHRIKGAAANVSSEKMQQTAWEMEKAGKNKDLRTLIQLISELENQFMILKRIIEEGA